MAVFSEEAGTDVRDLREATVLLAVQGPEAPSLLDRILGVAPRRMRAAAGEWQGDEIHMAGTGYTGEAGAELCLSPHQAPALVEALVAAGATAAGLGARDTLRLEAGLPLWGSDIDETTTPLEAGLLFAVSFEHDFVGREALIEQDRTGPERRLVGVVMEERGVPRHGHALRTPTGGTGSLTSGNMSPMLGSGIGMGYLTPPPAPGDTAVEVEIRDRWLAARIVDPPFYP
jgi:aminomethyltransferase